MVWYGMVELCSYQFFRAFCFYKRVREIDFTGKKRKEIIMSKLAKIGQAARFLFNRARGVQYGGVRFQGSGVKLVKTSRLQRLNMSLEDNFGSYAKNLSGAEFEGIMRQTKPLQRGAKIRTSAENLQYINAHGYSQIYDNNTNQAVMDICEHLENPIRTFFRYI